MNIKKSRLAFKDLFKGRIIYLAEPGCPVVGAKVVGSPITSAVKATAIGKRKDINPGQAAYRPLTNVEVAQLPDTLLDSDDEMIAWDMRFPSKHIAIEINGILHGFQDIYFDPAESRLRAFRKKRQAEIWAAYPDDHLSDLETIFTDY